jgi:hypothetical protein
MELLLRVVVDAPTDGVAQEAEVKLLTLFEKALDVSAEAIFQFICNSFVLFDAIAKLRSVRFLVRFLDKESDQLASEGFNASVHKLRRDRMGSAMVQLVIVHGDREFQIMVPDTITEQALQQRIGGAIDVPGPYLTLDYEPSNTYGGFHWGTRITVKVSGTYRPDGRSAAFDIGNLTGPLLQVLREPCDHRPYVRLLKLIPSDPASIASLSNMSEFLSSLRGEASEDLIVYMLQVLVNNIKKDQIALDFRQQGGLQFCFDCLTRSRRGRSHVLNLLKIFEADDLLSLGVGLIPKLLELFPSFGKRK